MGSIIFKSTTLIDKDFSQKRNIFVGISKDKIDYIGNEYKSGYEREIDGTGYCLMPAFYNSHAHSPMALLRGYAENLSLNEWLFKKIFPFEATLNDEDIYQSMLLSFAEMIRFGCVSTSDMYYCGSSMAKAVLESGAKSNISLAATTENFSRLKKEYIDLINEFGDISDRLKIDFSIHAPYTSNPEVVGEISDLAYSYGSNMHIHLSETSGESIECKKKYALTPTEYFDKYGAFRVPTIAAHCVYIEENDYKILMDKGVTVATCPTSNLKLASGICNVVKLYENHINVALGTDSVASNNNLDMFEEMKLFSLLQKGINKDPTVITPSQCLYAATKAGAKAQGRFFCGEIKVGNKADLVVIDLDRPHLTPVHDVLNTLVYSANGADVIMTICDGKVLYENGDFKTIDIEKVKWFARNRIMEKTND